MSLNYYIRVANLGHMDADNRDRPAQAVLDSVEIPGSHILWKLMEGAGYKVSGPDGSCGEVADFKETTRGMSLRRHEALFNLFGIIKKEGECPNTGIIVLGDESAMYRVNAMVDALHLVLQMQKAAIEVNAPIMVTIAWS